MAQQFNQPGENNSFECRAYNKSGLALLYGVSRPTMYKWLKPLRKDIGPVQGCLFTPMQVCVIIRKLGPPGIHVIQDEILNFD